MLFQTTVLFSILSTLVSASCSLSSDGNYYCSQTSKVIFEGVGFSGSYKKVTDMIESSGTCSQETFNFSGNLSPLDEELSVHFRGPLHLLQFGVYYPVANNKKKRDADSTDCVTKQHHKHRRAVVYGEVTQTVYVDANGNTVAGSSSSTPTTLVSSIANAVGGSVSSSLTTLETATVSTSIASTSSASSATSSPASNGGSSTANTGDWERASYYSAGSSFDNVTFMNYYGGSGSGVWSASFGNSISYCNSDASGGSAKSVALDSTTIKSNVEFMIFSSNACSGNDCGYYREGIPAYHGFGGAEKIFVFEFQMPSDTSGNGYNQDMPAIWLLNAQIPRTLQYGDASCSCWKTGCGELDLFEILSAGSDKLICHLHDGQGAAPFSNNGGGGSQNYFARPTTGTMKAAVIFTGSDIHIMEVDDDFSAILSADTVSGWVNTPGSVASIGY
ncbi:target of Sbf [Scheffersomyces spartinae]|uniref:glucan endo-1,3-beta-D-glucosidase n=1 Tax=Scheffersomyces spartinae TaxID=45513 RepID=A0A9P8AJ00_9ASCO|nr:target of Sbf [Scheffersomyces spartinae]KAG7194324.1 target of Sbf [Scheffersomyces spartinae]